ncbi:MAG: hypothetical protein NTY53_16555 [Kiritimatiellaeota bacterium]|nr:hypothetical protein [Kiritimatiellota bacterium]
MKKIRSIAVVLVCLAGAASGVVPFERYQVILDRAPFGVAATSTQSVTALKNLRLSALIRMPDGPRAGFVDGQGKNDFVLRLNEKSENDVELLGVDYAKEQDTIRHEGQLLVLGMQPFADDELRASAERAEPRSAAFIAEPFARAAHDHESVHAGAESLFAGRPPLADAKIPVAESDAAVGYR